MKLALTQAEKVLGNTNENPAVGCVITKNNNLISASSTNINGRPHAESIAINKLKTYVYKSRLYTTLEPCSHYGKTSPCVKKIINKKINEVYFSIKDPDVRSFNKSSSKLKKHNIYVKSGLLKKELNIFYRSYIKYKKKIYPFVTCKMAISKDFFTINKRNKWITNKYSRGRVHYYRSIHDCIISTSNTIIKDNPMLNCRIEGLSKNSPVKIILDRKLRIPINSNVFRSPLNKKTIVFYNKSNKKKLRILKKIKIKFYKVDLDINDNLDLKKILIKIKCLGFSRVFIESGMKLMTKLFKENLVDDFKLFISKNNIGKNGKANIKKYLKSFLKNKHSVKEKANLFGDLILSYRMK